MIKMPRNAASILRRLCQSSGTRTCFESRYCFGNFVDIAPFPPRSQSSLPLLPQPHESIWLAHLPEPRANLVALKGFRIYACIGRVGRSPTIS